MENSKHFTLDEHGGVYLLRLSSVDGINRLTRSCVFSLTDAIRKLSAKVPSGLIITGSQHFFSAGAELAEITALNGLEAYRFSLMGQELMNEVDQFPAPVCAAVWGYCMGGGLDLALACDFRIAHPHAIFGHRGAALGLITGWGGTQRLPRLVGRARALEMFVAAEKVNAHRALQIGLVQELAGDPVARAMEILAEQTPPEVSS